MAVNAPLWSGRRPGYSEGEERVHVVAPRLFLAFVVLTAAPSHGAVSTPLWLGFGGPRLPHSLEVMALDRKGAKGCGNDNWWSR